MKFIRDYIKNNKIAVTLMELVVAISIVGFILVAAITYNMIGEKFYHSTSKQATALNDAQYLIEQMGKDIKLAADVSIDKKKKVVKITQPGGNVVTYTYQEDEGKDKGKVYCDSGEGDELFASNVVQFDVSNAANNSVTVELRLRIGKEEDKSKEESHYVTTFYLRNK